MPDQPPAFASLRPRRSVLYMPGSNARALEKARSLAADALILDLEDAVAPEQKDMARALVCEAVRQGFGPREVIVRINTLASPWGKADLDAVAAVQPDAILLPKVNDAGDVRRVAECLPPAAPTVLWAMIETPRGVVSAPAIAAAGARLACLVLGSNDLIKELGARHTRDRRNLFQAMSQVVLAARAFGLAVIDGVYNDIADSEGFARACHEARDFGFDGKTVIHPSQIEPCNTAFAPDAAEIAAAEKIVAAFALAENQGKGAIKVDGHMVERLHETMAQKTLALAAAVKAQ